MDLRLCTQADLPAVLNLFRTSVHTLCRGEYTPAQLDAWAPEDLDNAPWARRVQCQTFLLAEEDGDLMGFASLEGDYLDLLYVHPPTPIGAWAPCCATPWSASVPGSASPSTHPPSPGPFLPAGATGPWNPTRWSAGAWSSPTILWKRS